MSKIQEVLGKIPEGQFITILKGATADYVAKVVDLDPAKISAVDVEKWTPEPGPEPATPVWGEGKWTLTIPSGDYAGTYHFIGQYDEEAGYTYGLNTSSLGGSVFRVLDEESGEVKDTYLYLATKGTGTILAEDVPIDSTKNEQTVILDDGVEATLTWSKS